MELEFDTADVFTTRRFGGNPLAVVHGADHLDGARMQAIAREFNLSETVFVMGSGMADARLRIFTPGMEVPFAGHPNVGAAVILARRKATQAEVLRLEQAAGIVPARLTRNPSGTVVAAEIEAPKPFRLGATLDAASVAACCGLPEGALHVTAHPPLVAGCGLDFAIAEVEDAALLAEASPDLAAFRRLFREATGILLHTPLAIGRRRARMFSPIDGIPEDPATGSANCALSGLLLHLAGGQQISLEVEQGMEMGRPSLLHLGAWRDEQGDIRARVGGGVVPVASGVLRV
jgi:trans-2,3-dihydro-3-hydroxyanthranilate isomerase